MWLDQCFAMDGSARSDCFFCSFLSHLATQCGVLSTKGFSVPGSDVIEAAAIHRLASVNPKSYSDTLIDACSSWVHEHPQSLDGFLQASLSQMNVHNATTVMDAIRFMKLWLMATIQNKVPKPLRIPDDVRLEFTNNAIHVLLSCDSFQVSLRTIVFLYDHINLLSFEARHSLISGILLEKSFFRLFLHWLAEVRIFFCNLLVYKVFRESRFDVFRELMEMEHLQGLQLQVPAHLGRNRTNDSIDEDNMQDFCLMAKFAFYLGTPLQHIREPSREVVRVGDVVLGPGQLVYSQAAIQQLKETIEESYEWGLDEFPSMLPKGMMAPR